MEQSLKGQVALVTGASSGFGAGMAKQLTKNGVIVFIIARRTEKLALVADETGAIPITADITKPEDWDLVFKEILEKEGRLDVLVNNAGNGGSIVQIEEQTDTAILNTIQTNLTSVIWGCKRAAAIMKNQKSGIIINISSVCAVKAWPDWSVYGAAKAGLEQFTRHLYVELRPYGVKATILRPSWGTTEFKEASQLEAFDRETEKKVIQPEEIGNLVVDICRIPAHLLVPEISIYPMVQEINPY
ncbi:SDR family NAD(P)-dependent oxidoreductase [Maribellus comscasis]|uniref:SDR family NAD(P)-dependent oxidoreductase n=1 Tax=Maribellus comscasis TaxID=2681766 RepID=A0A6I6K3G8_9BACT|nr:SDR family oxidoreductase [Maribellus comscasis]QGY46962.1 SDR family NAD(P)-dependent oxidoreductase [Maribellus comscasis]